VGDSGYFKDPITTHGMTDALRDAELLAGALLAAWSGAVPEAVALRRYQAQRDRLSRGLFTATNRIATYDWDQSAVQGLLREVSASMSDETELLQTLPVQRECTVVPSCPTDMLLPRR
jgi:2-polyprenyl-6-methoxyphenol hydroxylase-like FAD-dependent oxidoreductase